MRIRRWSHRQRYNSFVCYCVVSHVRVDGISLILVQQLTVLEDFQGQITRLSQSPEMQTAYQLRQTDIKYNIHQRSPLVHCSLARSCHIDCVIWKHRKITPVTFHGVVFFGVFFRHWASREHGPVLNRRCFTDVLCLRHLACHLI